jgi:pseudouridine-5'-phosphate glycosidase
MPGVIRYKERERNQGADPASVAVISGWVRAGIPLPVYNA